MRVLTAILGTVAGMLPTVNAFAASGAGEDNSGFLVTLFLGLCGIIMVGQLVPALMVMLGFAKGIRKAAKSETA